ncbi:hypothetical protein ACJIZ3_005260 [Penstemon smallii]|uniref:Uncharacterized protein n=1 Tax=Penstemon smallii TaxID=265156 RepID=A0ABD3S4M1_9LAMI
MNFPTLHACSKIVWDFHLWWLMIKSGPRVSSWVTSLTKTFRFYPYIKKVVNEFMYWLTLINLILVVFLIPSVLVCHQYIQIEAAFPMTNIMAMSLRKGKVMHADAMLLLLYMPLPGYKD